MYCYGPCTAHNFIWEETNIIGDKTSKSYEIENPI